MLKIIIEPSCAVTVAAPVGEKLIVQGKRGLDPWTGGNVDLINSSATISPNKIFFLYLAPTTDYDKNHPRPSFVRHQFGDTQRKKERTDLLNEMSFPCASAIPNRAPQFANDALLFAEAADYARGAAQAYPSIGFAIKPVFAMKKVF